VVFGVVIYPVLRTLLISFFKVDSPVATETPFVGLGNYSEALSDPRFWSTVGHTAYFAGVSITLELIFGIGIALLLNAPLRARWLFRCVVILP
jgi:ABC-type sugar transport system permease subunit